MNTHLHLDCFSGISGDMLLGALIDVGLSPAALRRGLKSLNVEGYRLKISSVHRGTLKATKVDVKILGGYKKPMSLARIRKTIIHSRLPETVKASSLKTFELLAHAEGTVHGVLPSKVHFHEVGVIDSFVDVVGGILGCHLLNIQTVSVSPVNLGSGFVNSSHGVLPVPAPAVAQLATQVPVFSSGPSQELTTPTGLSLLLTLAQEYQPFPYMVPHRIGYGAGTQNLADWPNVLRVFLGKKAGPAQVNQDRVVQIETNLDDLNPQVYEAVIERLFSVGALDATLTPVIMKKGRPGIVLSALTDPGNVERIVQTLFEETSTLGVRVQEVSRYILPRYMETLHLKKGAVRVKVAPMAGKKAKFIPEYQDCQSLAKKTGQPVRSVIQEVIQALQSYKPKSTIPFTR